MPILSQILRWLSRPCPNVTTPTRVLQGFRSPSKRTCPRMRFYLLTSLGAWEGPPRQSTELPSPARRPERAQPMAGRDHWGAADVGTQKAGECRMGHPSHRRHLSEGARPSPRNQAASPAPYLTQQQRQLRFTAFTANAAKGAVKRKAVDTLVAVGDVPTVLTWTSAHPRRLPIHRPRFTDP